MLTRVLVDPPVASLFTHGSYKLPCLNQMIKSLSSWIQFPFKGSNWDHDIKILRMLKHLFSRFIGWCRSWLGGTCVDHNIMQEVGVCFQEYPFEMGSGGRGLPCTPPTIPHSFLLFYLCQNCPPGCDICKTLSSSEASSAPLPSLTLGMNKDK